MKNNWTYQTLNELAENKKNAIVDGPFGSNLKLSDYVSEGVPVLQGNNITGNLFKFTDIRFISQEKANTLIRSKAIVGDLLIVKIGSVGYSAIIDDLNGYDYAIIPANLLKVSLDKDKVLPEYVYQYLTSSEGVKKLKGIASSTAQPALSLGKVKQLNIPLPKDIKCQQKIADILSSVNETVQKTNQIIQKTEFLKQELTKTLLTKGINHKNFKKTKVGVVPENWNIVSLKEVTKIASGQVDPKNEPYASMILVAPNHVESGSGRILERECAKDQQAISGKYLVEKGDVIYSKIRPYLKKVTIADSACLCSADMYPMKGLNNLNNNFLFHILLSEHFTNYANSNSGRTGIPKLNREELGNYTFALPPIKEQIEISSILSSMDEKILTNQEIKKKYVLIKNGLMNDIFNQKVQIN